MKLLINKCRYGETVVEYESQKRTIFDSQGDSVCLKFPRHLFLKTNGLYWYFLETKIKSLDDKLFYPIYPAHFPPFSWFYREWNHFPNCRFGGVCLGGMLPRSADIHDYIDCFWGTRFDYVNRLRLWQRKINRLPNSIFSYNAKRFYKKYGYYTTLRNVLHLSQSDKLEDMIK